MRRRGLEPFPELEQLKPPEKLRRPQARSCRLKKTDTPDAVRLAAIMAKMPPTPVAVATRLARKGTPPVPAGCR